MAPAAGTAKTDASMQAESAAGARTPSLLSRVLSLDIFNRESELALDRNRFAICFTRSFELECLLRNIGMLRMDFAICFILCIRIRLIF